MKSITVVCRNFLWSGQIHTSKAPLIAWEVVCQSKKEGGLGITECIGWNEAAIAKYVWNVENKTDNIWVKWVHQIYIKGADWWQYQPQAESCWYWRKICSIKGKFAAGYSGNKWLHSNGEYTIQSGYRWKSGNGSQWPWWRDTWNKMNVPRHSFICWLAMHRRLLTRDRLARMGVCQETECLLCGCKPENIDHLFFECDYSKKCLEGVLEWMGLNIQRTNMEGIWSRLVRKEKGKISRALIRAIIAALIYHIWQARNGALWNKVVIRPTEIMKKIREESKGRCMSRIIAGIRCKDRKWIDNLYV
ncbi:hypothetical protein KY289_006002 [Solanum tuberosum]|nr:hypothetical protein KY289_006002 [Solanum tuberosum]